MLQWLLLISACALINTADGLKCYGCSSMAATEEEANENCMNFFVEHDCSLGNECYYQRTAKYGKIFIRKGCKLADDCKVNTGYCCTTELCNENMPFSSAQHYTPEVMCDNDVIRITINPTRMTGLDLSGIRAGSSASVSACQARQTNAGMTELTFGITQCETEQMIGPDDITYKVRINSGSTSMKTTGITRKKIMGLEVRCTYERSSEDIDSQFVGDVTTVKYVSNSTGAFKYSMGFYEDLLFRSPIHPGTHVTVQQRIYSKIKMQSDNDLFMYVRDCFAARSRSGKEVKHWFIQDGCIDGDATFKQLLVEHDLYEFEFQAFKFRGAVDTVYVVCRAIVCSRDESEAPCVPPSKAACLSPDSGPLTTKTRVKRSASHPLYMVYHGPISIATPGKDGGAAEVKTSEDDHLKTGLLVMAAICLVAVVTAVTVLVLHKTRTRRARNESVEQRSTSDN